MQRVTPLLQYGIVTIIVALLSILLPETIKRKLLEQVKDAEHEESLETERWVYIIYMDNYLYDLMVWWTVLMLHQCITTFIWMTAVVAQSIRAFALQAEGCNWVFDSQPRQS